MSPVTLHFPSSEPSSIPVIPAGLYRMRFQGAKLDYARGSGNATISGMLKILQGEWAGQGLPHQYSLQEDVDTKQGALWRIKNDLRNTGRLTEEMIAKGVAFEMTDEQTLALLEGMEGWADIFLDTYNNQPRSKLSSTGFITDDDYNKRMQVATSVATPATPVATATPTVTKPASGSPSVNLGKKPF